MPPIARTPIGQLDAAALDLVSAVTGLSLAELRRFARASPDEPAGQALGGMWPPRRAQLAALRVSQVRANDLSPELAAHVDRSARWVRSRIEGANGHTKLGTLFPELAVAELPSIEEVGLATVPVKAVRGADPFVRWWAIRMGRSLGWTRSKLGDAHGSTHLGTLFEDTWPTEVGDEGALAAMLGELDAALAADLEPFTSWIAWFVDERPHRVRARLTAPRVTVEPRTRSGG